MEVTKAVLVNETGMVGWSAIPGGRDSADQVARQVLSQLMIKSGISSSNIDCVVATGIGKDYVSLANQKAPEFMCLASGVNMLLPSTSICLDLGTRKSLAVKCRDGKTLKMASSSKCAAGTGTYLKMVANIFNMSIEETSQYSMKSQIILDIQTTCAVFAESEIISLIHNGNKPEDILKGVFRGLAERIYPQLLELGAEREITLVGGFAKIPAIVTNLEALVGFPLQIADNPLIVGALGAALIGQKKRS
jgi:predicted CoA-substrate-specific enzyme activase